MPVLPPIISVDDHLIEPPDLWERYLPAKLRDRGPRVVRAPYERTPGTQEVTLYPYRIAKEGPETDFWLYEDLQVAFQATMVNPAKELGDEGIRPYTYDMMRPGTHQVQARLADMDIAGVERSMCFPNFPRFCGQTFYEGKDKEMGLACVEAYNNFMVEEWAGESGGRLIPLCMIPLWDPELAATEVRRNAARGVRAVTFCEIPPNLGLPSIHSRHWDPFFQACDETGTVLCIHIGSGSKVLTTSDDAPGGLNMALFTINSQLSFADWLTSGNLARFPNLKVAFSEAQIGWMPYLIEQIDRIWEKPRSLTNLDPIISQPPSSYVPDRIFGCFFADSYGIENRHILGVDQITFESDYPHQDTNWPDTRKVAEELLDGVSEEDVYKIVRGNAIKLFQLPEELPA